VLVVPEELFSLWGKGEGCSNLLSADTAAYFY